MLRCNRKSATIWRESGGLILNESQDWIETDEVLRRVHDYLPAKKRVSMRTLQRYVSLGIVSEPKTFYDAGNIGRISIYPENACAELFAAHTLINGDGFCVKMAKMAEIRAIANYIETRQMPRTEWMKFFRQHFKFLPVVWQWLIEKKRFQAAEAPEMLLGLTITLRDWKAEDMCRANVELVRADEASDLRWVSIFL